MDQGQHGPTYVGPSGLSQVWVFFQKQREAAGWFQAEE